MTSCTLPPLLMPLPIYTPLPTSSFPLPSSIPSTSGSESIPEAGIPLRKRARFTTPTSRYEIGESSVAAAARQIRPTLTIAESRRADGKLLGRLRRERRYFHTVATTYAQEKMAPKRRTTRLNPGTTPVTTPSTTTTSITNAQLQAMINEGVNDALAARDTTRNGDDSHTSGIGARRLVQAAHECSYSEFLKCKPLEFKGTEGVVELTRWFKKMESVFSISNCTTSNQVKGNDVVAYNRRFQQLALMCSRMFPKEIEKIEKYIDGLPDMILGSVKASKSKTMQEV
nr:hypothetical protein [Tanacetum cinerariifolium]